MPTARRGHHFNVTPISEINVDLGCNNIFSCIIILLLVVRYLST